jgi:hypothetical protein
LKPSPPRHGPAKGPRLRNILEKIEERSYQLQLAAFQQEIQKDETYLLPNRKPASPSRPLKYKGYNKPPAFGSSTKANQFVDDWANKKPKFLENHNKMPTPGIFSPIKKIHSICSLKTNSC